MTKSNEDMSKEELFFEAETRKHQQEVSKIMMMFAQELLRRAMVHDASKMEDPERETFIRVTPLLRLLTYGSPEYKVVLQDMGPALEHHYANNDHHPEHGDDLEDMGLFAIVEMICDWMAAVKRGDGDIFESLRKNKVRFGMSPQLMKILINTAHQIKEMEHGAGI